MLMVTSQTSYALYLEEASWNTPLVHGALCNNQKPPTHEEYSRHLETDWINRPFKDSPSFIAIFHGKEKEQALTQKNLFRSQFISPQCFKYADKLFMKTCDIGFEQFGSQVSQICCLYYPDKKCFLVIQDGAHQAVFYSRKKNEKFFTEHQNHNKIMLTSFECTAGDFILLANTAFWKIIPPQLAVTFILENPTIRINDLLEAMKSAVINQGLDNFFLTLLRLKELMPIQSATGYP